MRITLIKKLFFKSSPKRVHAHKHKRQPTALHKIHKLISNENTTDTCTAYHCSHQTQFLKNKSAPKWSSSPSSSLPVTPAGIQGNNEAPPPLSVTDQPPDGAPAVVHVHYFCFHSSSPGGFRMTTLLLSLLDVEDCNFGDGVGILAQLVPNPAPSLPGDDSLQILLLAQC